MMIISPQEKVRTLSKLLEEITQDFEVPEEISSKEICLFCNCSAHQIRFSLSDPWNPIWQSGRLHFKNSFGFRSEDLVICIMHAFERLVESTLERTVKDNIEARKWTVLWFSKLKRKDLPSWAQKQTLLWPGNIYLTIHDKPYDPEDADFVKAKFGMIPWKFCQIIKIMAQRYLTALNKFMEECGVARFVGAHEFELWKQLSDVWDIVHAKSKEVNIKQQTLS
jgi:hypothetical protein